MKPCARSIRMRAGASLDVVAYLHSTAEASLEFMGSMYGFSLVGAEHVVVLDWCLESPIMMGADRQDFYSKKPNCSCGYRTSLFPLHTTLATWISTQLQTNSRVCRSTLAES